jgi:hypothetical protein
MTQLDGSHSSRYCAECREERVFGRFHADLGSCPDVPDGDCPEWGCTSCGECPDHRGTGGIRVRRQRPRDQGRLTGRPRGLGYVSLSGSGRKGGYDTIRRKFGA